jgi:hypothetical protein
MQIFPALNCGHQALAWWVQSGEGETLPGCKVPECHRQLGVGAQAI